MNQISIMGSGLLGSNLAIR